MNGYEVYLLVEPSGEPPMLFRTPIRATLPVETWNDFDERWEQSCYVDLLDMREDAKRVGGDVLWLSPALEAA